MSNRKIRYSKIRVNLPYYSFGYSFIESLLLIHNKISVYNRIFRLVKKELARTSKKRELNYATTGYTVEELAVFNSLVYSFSSTHCNIYAASSTKAIKIAKYLILLLFIYFTTFSIVHAQTLSSIQGSVSNSRTGEKVPGLELIVSKTNGEELARTTTDGSGNFAKSYIVTDVEDFDVVIPREFDYKLYNTIGQQIASGNASSTKVLRFNPANSAYFLELKNEKENFYAVMKGVSINHYLEFRLDEQSIKRNFSVPKLRKSSGVAENTDLDSVDVTLKKAGFTTTKTRIPYSQNISRNFSAEKIPYVVGFKIKPFDVNGNKIDTLTLEFKTSDSTRTYSVDGTGMVNVNWIDYKNNADTTAIMDHKNNYWSPIITLRKPQQPWNEENLSGNGASTYLGPIAKTNLNLNKMIDAAVRDSSHLYLLRNEVLTNTVKAMLSRGPPGIDNWKAPYVDGMIFTYNLTTGAKLQQSIIDQMKNVMDEIFSKYTLNNGEKLLNYRIHLVNSPSDSIYLAAEARGWSNTFKVWRENIATPGNQIVYVTAENKIDETSAFGGNGLGSGTEMGEQGAAAIGGTDPTINGIQVDSVGDILMKGSGVSGKLGKNGIDIVRFVQSAKRGIIL